MTLLALPSRKHSSEASLEAYCRALWQTQERAKRPGRPLHIPAIPLLRTEPEILYALFKIECHVSDSWLLIDILWDRILELIEPQPAEAADEAWRGIYWDELEQLPKLQMALSEAKEHRMAKVLRWLTQVLELTDSEREVLRFWLAGDDPRTIARLMGRRRTTVELHLRHIRAGLLDLGHTRRARDFANTD